MQFKSDPFHIFFSRKKEAHSCFFCLKWHNTSQVASLCYNINGLTVLLNAKHIVYFLATFAILVFIKNIILLTKQTWTFRTVPWTGIIFTIFLSKIRKNTGPYGIGTYGRSKNNQCFLRVTICSFVFATSSVTVILSLLLMFNNTFLYCCI